MKSAIKILERFVSRTAKFFLPLAAVCAFGVTLIFVGQLLGFKFLTVTGVVLGLPFWLWCIPFSVLCVFGGSGAARRSMVGRPKAKGEPGGPANGSQPVRSGTNSTSGATGSRR